MSVRINGVACGVRNGFSWTLREASKRITQIVLGSSCFGERLRGSVTLYAAAGSTVILDLQRAFSPKPLPLALSVNFTSLPQFYPLLHLEFTSPLKGFVSTPHWDGATSSRHGMDTWVKVAVPTGHDDVMVSVPDIDIGRPSWCSTDFFLGLYANPASSDPLNSYCQQRIPGPSAHALGSNNNSSGHLYIHFIAKRRRYTRFKLRFSFHPRSLGIPRLAEASVGDGVGVRWNCSVAQWPEIRDHFPCNLQADCLEGEDEADCPYTSRRCGEGRLTIAGRCYVFEASEKESTWVSEEEGCRRKGGVLPQRDVHGIDSFLRGAGFVASFFVGVIAPSTSLPLLYRYMWTHLDSSIAHYVGTMFLDHGDHIENSYTRALMRSGIQKAIPDAKWPGIESLCEVPPATSSDEEDPAAMKSENASTPKKLLPRLPFVDWEQSGFWWSDARYWRCPRGHVTHSFLACDTQASCWGKGNPFGACSVTGVTSGIRPLPLPPSMACDHGAQRVPYSLVCDTRPDCVDQTDELFCVFAPCDVLTQFTCDDKTCVPHTAGCDGKPDCSDSSDEENCFLDFDHYTQRKTVDFPALLVFNRSGYSVVRPLSAALSFNGETVNGTLVRGSLTGVTLTGETLVNGTLAEETGVSGTVVSGVLASAMLLSGTLIVENVINGTLVPSESPRGSGTAVRGCLVGGRLVSSTLVNGVLKKGVLVNATVARGAASCPDSHFWCADERYCVPVFTRCNGLFDCPTHEDEAGCDRYQCPGFYRCRGSTVCLHRRDVCDGVSHCPKQDDEALCNFTCPSGCTCYGHAFFCRHHGDVKTAVALSPKLRYLDASDSAVDVRDVENNTMLVHLSLVRCNIVDWGPVSLPNLRSLDLSENNVTQISCLLISRLPNLKQLTLARNPLASNFVSKMACFQPVPRLRSLDMSGVFLPEVNVTLLSVFRNLRVLNFTQCRLKRILGGGFRSLRKLRVLDLSRNPLLIYFPRDVFRGLGDLRAISADNYKLCCPATLPDGFHHQNCRAPTDAVSACKALLRSAFFRVCLYLFAVLSCLGNLSSLTCRLAKGKIACRTSFDVFVVNLCVSDFLMGVYLVIIGAADRSYTGTYLWFELAWRHSAACQVAGFLCLVSNEVSAFVVCLITLDRFLVLCFPFGQLRFSTTAAFVASALVWGICFAIAAVPLLPEAALWRFYSQTGICMPLPTSWNDFEGRGYLFGVLIVLNFVLFVLVVLGQLLVYASVRKHSVATAVTTATALHKDQTLARRLLTVALTDFLCWFPVGLVGLMAAKGHHLPGEVDVAIAIFGLPLKSAINPFLYTLNAALERQRQARELRLKQFLVAHIKAQHGASSGDVAQFGTNCKRGDAEQLLKLWLVRGILFHEHVSNLLEQNGVSAFTRATEKST